MMTDEKAAMPPQAFSSEDKKAERIIDFLRKEFGLPKLLIGFELHIKCGEFVMVKNLHYYPEDDPKGK